jgi:hypothetical protein
MESSLSVVKENTGLQEKQSSGFALQPQSFDEAMRIATMISNSQLAPKDFRGKPEDTMVAMMMGQELGLNPMQAIQNIAVINGRPALWGDALLALVQNHPSFVSIEETLDESTMTATCTVKRKGGKPHTATFSKADAETAGLWGRNTWKQYPARMLAMRARGFALRNQFADALCGLITREEAEDIPREIKEVNAAHGHNETKTESPKADLLPEYPAQDFKNNLSKWVDLINADKKTADDIVAMVSTKYTLTTEQINEIRSFA